MPANIYIKKSQRSQEECRASYVEDVLRIHGGRIIPKEPYINSATKILHECTTCNYEWKPTPNKILLGRGCPKCSGLMKITPEQYTEQLRIISNGTIISKEPYINASTKILHRCLICNHEWKTAPDNIRSGKRCPPCAYKNMKNNIMSAHNAKMAYQDKINKIYNNTIILTGIYTNSKIKTEHKCQICNNFLFSRPNDILQGHGCRYCSNRYIPTNAEYIQKIYNIYKDTIKVTGIYKNALSKLSHECYVHGKIEKTPSSLLSGRGCKKCNQIGRYCKKYFEKFPKKCNTPSSFYLIELSNKHEKFLKVGITTNIKNRKYKFSPYKCKIISTINTTLYDAFIKEQKFIKEYSHIQYTPTTNYGGHTECFQYNNEILTAFNELPQIYEI